jgi:hypothetical protein
MGIQGRHRSVGVRQGFSFLKQAKLVALHKKGDPALPDNYRGITLRDVYSKVFVTVLHQRIRQHL